MVEIETLAAGVLALPGRRRGAQSLAQALRDPLLAAVLWRVLRDEAVWSFPDRAALDGAVDALTDSDAALPEAPSAALLKLCTPERPVLTLAVTGGGDLVQAVFKAADRWGVDG
jgi:hypothetical protein